MECKKADTRVTKSCEVCGEVFTVYRSRGHRRFCSHACYAKAKLGSSNPNWRGGKDPHYYGSNWPVLSEQIRKRDNYTCQACGKHQSDAARSHAVHHIKPFVSFPRHERFKANRSKNLITLCQPCHVKAEGAVP